MSRACAFAVTLLLVAGCHRAASGPSIQPDAARGRVVSLNHRPLPGSQIRITGCADQVTASDGSFDTRCAATPYDLAATTANVGIIYQGLTRRDPVATSPVEVGSDGWCFVHGTIGGRVEGREAGVLITSTASASQVTGLGAMPNGFFSSDVRWLDTSPSATIRGIEWTGTLNGPTAFTAYGAVRVPLDSVDAAAAGPIPVEPDRWAWQRPFSYWPPPADGFATRHRMTVQVWQP